MEDFIALETVMTKFMRCLAWSFLTINGLYLREIYSTLNLEHIHIVSVTYLNSDNYKYKKRRNFSEIRGWKFDTSTTSEN